MPTIYRYSTKGFISSNEFNPAIFLQGTYCYCSQITDEETLNCLTLTSSRKHLSMNYSLYNSIHKKKIQ